MPIRVPRRRDGRVNNTPSLFFFKKKSVGIKMHVEGNRRAFLHVHNFKTFTKHNNRRNFRKLKCSSKFHKIYGVLQNATKILNN